MIDLSFIYWFGTLVWNSFLHLVVVPLLFGSVLVDIVAGIRCL